MADVRDRRLTSDTESGGDRRRPQSPAPSSQLPAPRQIWSIVCSAIVAVPKSAVTRPWPTHPQNKQRSRNAWNRGGDAQNILSAVAVSTPSRSVVLPLAAGATAPVLPAAQAAPASAVAGASQRATGHSQTGPVASGQQPAGPAGQGGKILAQQRHEPRTLSLRALGPWVGPLLRYTPPPCAPALLQLLSACPVVPRSPGVSGL